MPSLPPLDDLDALLFRAEAGAEAPELDLHGLRADEAMEALERLLHSAFVAGERVVRVIHGKGDGRLRDAAHARLARHPLVDRFKESHDGGVTLVALAKR